MRNLIALVIGPPHVAELVIEESINYTNSNEQDCNENFDVKIKLLTAADHKVRKGKANKKINYKIENDQFMRPWFEIGFMEPRIYESAVYVVEKAKE